MSKHLSLCTYTHTSLPINVQCKVLQDALSEQKKSVAEAQRALQEAKNTKEQIEQDNDRMTEEIAAW